MKNFLQYRSTLGWSSHGYVGILPKVRATLALSFHNMTQTRTVLVKNFSVYKIVVAFFFPFCLFLLVYKKMKILFCCILNIFCSGKWEGAKNEYMGVNFFLNVKAEGLNLWSKPNFVNKIIIKWWDEFESYRCDSILAFIFREKNTETQKINIYICWKEEQSFKNLSSLFFIL